jgi:hypothetical protein
MTPLTEITVRTYQPTNTLFSVELCAEGARLDAEHRRAVIAAYDDPESVRLCNFAEAAARALYTHKNGKYVKASNRFEGRCPHCHVRMYPRLAPAPAE